MDTVRVLRVIEYTGPRDLVEKQIELSIHGSKTYGSAGREVTIKVATIGNFPEILDEKGPDDERA